MHRTLKRMWADAGTTPSEITEKRKQGKNAIDFSAKKR